MTEKTVQKKKSSTSIDSLENLKLSIQFSLDGFSFCIRDLSTIKDVFFTEYQFTKPLNSPQELLEEIKTIFKEDKNLQYDFKEVNVIHQNSLNSIVPNEYFDKTLLLKYLDFNIRTLKTDFAAFDKLNGIEANNIYIPYVNINNYLFQHFGEFTYKHHISSYIEKLLQLDRDKKDESIYVNVSKNSFDLVVLKNKELILSNIFNYNNKEDFLYYILFIAEQLELDINKIQIYFSGKIHRDNDIYKLCCKYLKNISFLNSNNSLFDKIDAYNHSNFILLF